MKTTLIVALVLALSTPALAQPDMVHKWIVCQHDFTVEEETHVAVLEELGQAVKKGEWKLDAISCWDIVAADISLIDLGEVCNAISNRIPKNDPDKKAITRFNEVLLSQVRIFQKSIAKFTPICKRLQAKEAAQKVNEQDEDKMRQESVY
jgi:hypothetical protein